MMQTVTMDAEPEGDERPLSGIRVLSASVGVELFGHERSTIEVYKCLSALGAKVRVGVTTLHGGGEFAAELKRNGFETFSLPFGPQWSLRWVRKDPTLLWRNPLAVLRCSRLFGREMDSYRPTHVLIGSALAYSYLSLALQRSKVCVIYRNGDVVPSDSKFNFPIWKAALRRADTVVAISHFVKRASVAHGVDESKIVVVHNLAPTAGAYTPSRGNPRLTEALESPRIVYVGNIAEHKGLVPLVEAIAVLRRKWPSIHLDVVGGSRWDTEFRSRLIRLIAELGLVEQIQLLGFVDEPWTSYRRAHVHVAPSLWEEPLGNVVIEAKREGVPSIVFASGGLPESVRNGVDGVVCSEKTAEALANAIDLLLSDHRRLEAAGQAARADYAERFGPDRFARQWASVILGSRK